MLHLLHYHPYIAALTVSNALSVTHTMLVDQDANKDMVVFTLDEEHAMLVDPDDSTNDMVMFTLDEEHTMLVNPDDSTNDMVVFTLDEEHAMLVDPDDSTNARYGHLHP
ncbi:uncharacterized protein EDB91DRAFT_1088425 [Suillus paluster]|uniref:uncharacterized protein n=1 Tax=Suillus paluster TaxID=48578 RepID=UPI001B878327|nr:uncharacterized protein EDB91DRAFT_1088425 [Suillus paluster]KAG1721506.1 hypothetical protein EDB91DRAFT_1088425 [Suillus paluster]